MKRVTFNGCNKNPRYAAWSSMIGRCDDPNNKRYVDYGARCIKVCDQWYVFQQYLDDTAHLNLTGGRTVDRIDNDKGYYPENVRAATKSEQNINQRMRKDNTSKVVGVSFCAGTSKWKCQTRIYGKRAYLGLYDNLKDAKEARSASEDYRSMLGAIQNDHA